MSIRTSVGIQEKNKKNTIKKSPPFIIELPLESVKSKSPKK
jgi:hypothetical protein